MNKSDSPRLAAVETSECTIIGCHVPPSLDPHFGFVHGVRDIILESGWDPKVHGALRTAHAVGRVVCPGYDRGGHVDRNILVVSSVDVVE